MKKKILSIIIAISIILSCSVTTFGANSEPAYYSSLARVEAAIDYLNAEYLTSSLGNEFEYGTMQDKKELQALSNYITMGCSSETEKANAIYDWMLNNVDYDCNSFTAIDVFRTLSGICSGHAQLFTTLCRLSGIECAVIRGYKADTTYIDMEYVYTYGFNKSHEWSMAYCDGQWLLYDDLWGYKAIDTAEEMAHWYYLLHVDGIIPSVSIMDTNIDGAVANTYYDNGTYRCYYKGEPYTGCNNASMQVGGCLRYVKYYYWDGFKSYYRSESNSLNSVFGDSIAEGVYNYTYSYPVSIKHNGVAYMNTVINYNGKNYLSTGFGTPVIINNSIDSNGLTNGELNMHIGQSINLSELYENATYRIISSNDNIELEDGIITATSTGSATIRIKYRSEVTLYINIYGDIIESNELFQYLCDHNYTHIVNNYEYCNYCGALIGEVEEIEQEVTTEPAITVEEVVSEAAIEIEEVEVKQEIEPQEQEEVIEPVEEIVESIEEVNEPIEVVEEPIIEEVNELIEQVEEIVEPIEEEVKPTEEVNEPIEVVEEPNNESIIEVIEPIVKEVFEVVEEFINDIFEAPIEEEPSEIVEVEPIVEEYVDIEPTIENEATPLVEVSEPIEEPTLFEQIMTFFMPEEHTNELVYFAPICVMEEIDDNEIAYIEPIEIIKEEIIEQIEELNELKEEQIEIVFAKAEVNETKSQVEESIVVEEQIEEVVEVNNEVTQEVTQEVVENVVEEKLSVAQVINQIITSIVEFFKSLFK